jgi:hypothetical protein
MRGLLVVPLVWAIGIDAAAADAAQSAPQPAIERLDPRADALFPDGARVERIAAGLDWVEGPA